MPAGFQAWSDAGSIQLTDSRANPLLVASGNGTTVTNTVGGAPLITSNLRISYTLPSADHHPLLAIRPGNATVFYGVVKSGLTWTWEFLSAASVGTEVPYWIFDRKDTVAASGIFEIYNAAGQRTFSLAEKPLRIRSILTGTMGGAESWTHTSTFESGRTYAALVCRWSEQATYRPRPNNTLIYGLGVRGATNGLTLSNAQLVTVAGDATPSPFDTYQVLAIDVTNY